MCRKGIYAFYNESSGKIGKVVVFVDSYSFSDIIMGGTFPSFPIKYQENFVKYALKALNDFSQLFFIKNDLNIQKFKKFFSLQCFFVQ